MKNVFLMTLAILLFIACDSPTTLRVGPITYVDRFGMDTRNEDFRIFFYSNKMNITTPYSKEVYTHLETKGDTSTYVGDISHFVIVKDRQFYQFDEVTIEGASRHFIAINKIK